MEFVVKVHSGCIPITLSLRKQFLKVWHNNQRVNAFKCMCNRVDILHINVKRKEPLFCYLSKIWWLRMAGIIGADVECASDERKESLFCYLSKLWWLKMAGGRYNRGRCWVCQWWETAPMNMTMHFYLFFNEKNILFQHFTGDWKLGRAKHIKGWKECYLSGRNTTCKFWG